MKFSGTVRYFRPEQVSGLAVMDIPKKAEVELHRLEARKP